MPTLLKSGVKMSLSAVCTRGPGNAILWRVHVQPDGKCVKTALLVFCEEFIGHGGKLIAARSLTITQRRLVPAKFPAGLPQLSQSNAPRTIAE